MIVSGLLSGGAPVIKSYQVAQTFGTAGVPALLSANGEAGVDLATTTGAVDMVGVTLDTATYSTTQGTGANSAEASVRIIINPDAIIKIRMNQGATEGTALTLYTETLASATGTVITGGDVNTTDMDQGTIWCYSGANVGQARRITSTSTVAATVLVPFDNDTVVGDNFIVVPYAPMASATVQLSTLLTEADASIVIGTGAEFQCIELIRSIIIIKG